MNRMTPTTPMPTRKQMRSSRNLAPPMKKPRQTPRPAARLGIPAHPDRSRQLGRCSAAPRPKPKRAAAPRRPRWRSRAATTCRAARRPCHRRAAECRCAEPGARIRASKRLAGRRGCSATPFADSRLEASRVLVLKRVWGSVAGTHRRYPGGRSSAQLTRKTRDAPSAVRAAHVLRAGLRPRRKACCVSPSFARLHNCTAKRYGIQIFKGIAACRWGMTRRQQPPAITKWR